MAIFNSYVKLPEGKPLDFEVPYFQTPFLFEVLKLLQYFCVLCECLPKEFEDV